LTEPDSLRTRLREAAAAFLALRQAVLAGEPWSLAAAFDNSTEAQWGPPEVLAHVAEMLPYWLGEVERIVAAAPAPAPFGRAANDPVRLAIIGRDRTVPLRELFDRVTSDSARFERRLAGLGATDLDRVGLHPVGGLVAVGDVVEGFVVAHLADHAVQLRELLSMPPSAAGG
jgi:hypothetical protein